VEPIGTDTPWLDLVPYTEFDYSQSLIASRLTTLPDFRLTPGLAYLGDYCEVSVGAQVALGNRSDARATRPARPRTLPSVSIVQAG
jgi:hypothetical protein